MDPTLEQMTMRKVYLRLLPLAMFDLFLLLPRPHQCQLRRADHEQGYRPRPPRPTAWLDRLLSRLLPVRGAEQHHPRQGRRAALDRAHHDHLGIASGATAFATGPYSFLTVRFLLGLAEAGLFPGIVLLFTYWFPDQHRARIISGFTLALPVAVALGAPISTALLGSRRHARAIAGWKWMFLIEAVPTVLIGFVVLFSDDRQAGASATGSTSGARLADRHDRARAPRGRSRQRKFSMLAGALEPEGAAAVAQLLRHRHGQPGHAAVPAADHQVARLHQHGSGWATMIPYLCGAISMMAWGWISDRIGERRWNLFWACVLADRRADRSPA